MRCHSRRALAAAPTFAAIFLAVPLSAQQSAPLPKAPQSSAARTDPVPIPVEEVERLEKLERTADFRRLALWSVEAVGGGSLGGPEDSLVDAMRTSGWADTMPAFFGGSISYPSKDASGQVASSYWIAARHRLGTGPLHVGLAVGQTVFGGVTGHHLSRGSPYPNDFLLSTASDLTTVAALGWFEVTRGLRLGAGPSANIASVRFSGTGAPDRPEVRETKAGFVVELGLVAPVDTPVYFTALVQYRYAASVAIPGWEKVSVSGATASFAPTRVSMSHAVYAIGIGGRW